MTNQSQLEKLNEEIVQCRKCARLVASFGIAGQSNGFDPAAAHGYRQRMAEYAGMPTLQVWNDSFDLETVIENMPDKENKRFYTKKLAKATEQSAHEKEFARLAFKAGDPPRIVDQPPLIYHYGDIRDKKYLQTAIHTLQGYKKNVNLGVSLLLDRFQVMDVAFKVVGVGSVGTMRGIILLMSGTGDPLFLQFKQARQSVLEPYCGANPYSHAGQRVVAGQRALCRRQEICSWVGRPVAAKGKYRSIFASSAMPRSSLSLR